MLLKESPGEDRSRKGRESLTWYLLMSQSGSFLFSVGMELEKVQSAVLLLSVNPESVEAGWTSVQGFQGTSKVKEKPGDVCVYGFLSSLHYGEDLLECGDQEFIGNHLALGSIGIPRMSRSI